MFHDLTCEASSLRTACYRFAQQIEAKLGNGRPWKAATPASLPTVIELRIVRHGRIRKARRQYAIKGYQPPKEFAEVGHTAATEVRA